MSDYVVVPYGKRNLVKCGPVYRFLDRKAWVIVCTKKTEWMESVPIALRFVDDGDDWRWIAYAKGKNIASRDSAGLKGDTAKAAKLLGVDATKLEAAADAEKFRVLVGFSRYAIDPAMYQAIVDKGFGERENMQRLADAQEPVKQARAKPKGRAR